MNPKQLIAALGSRQDRLRFATNPSGMIRWLAEIQIDAYRQGLSDAATIATAWGNECAGGSGGEIIPEGPNRGQRYGEAYYNLAKAILNKSYTA